MCENEQACGYRKVLEECHVLLSRAGIPDATGRPCDDPNCNSKLYHRIKMLLETAGYRDLPPRQFHEASGI